MSKGPWESRIGSLLKADVFAYAYKPVDSPMHGGSVRIDWLAADMQGAFWMVEVKQVAENARSINVALDVTALQRAALSDVAATGFGVPVLAVGQGNMLYLWGWRYVQWLQQDQRRRALPKPDLIFLDTAMWGLHWTGKTKWQSQYDLQELLVDPDGNPLDRDLHSVQMVTMLSPWLPEQGVYPLTLRQHHCILTDGKMQRLELSSSKPEGSASSSVSTQSGGTKSSPTKTRKS